MEQCAIRNSILTEGVKSFVTPQRERFMCAVKPFEVNCILLSFCACNILCSSLYRDRGRCLCLSRSYSQSALCLFVYSITVWTHLPICLWTQRTRQAITFECICSRTVKNNQWSAEVCRLAGSCGGLRHSDCDRDRRPHPSRLWLVSRSEPRPRGKDWKDSKTSNLGDLMHRVPDDFNVLQLSFTTSLRDRSAVYYCTPFWAVSQ